MQEELLRSLNKSSLRKMERSRHKQTKEEDYWIFENVENSERNRKQKSSKHQWNKSEMIDKNGNNKSYVATSDHNLSRDLDDFDLSLEMNHLEQFIESSKKGFDPVHIKKVKKYLKPFYKRKLITKIEWKEIVKNSLKKLAKYPELHANEDHFMNLMKSVITPYTLKEHASPMA